MRLLPKWDAPYTAPLAPAHEAWLLMNLSPEAYDKIYGGQLCQDYEFRIVAYNWVAGYHKIELLTPGTRAGNWGWEIAWCRTHAKAEELLAKIHLFILTYSVE